MIGTFLAFVFIGYFRMWDETMSTIAIILTSVIMSVVIGLPIGRPITTDMITDVSMIAMVLIVSSHILK